jgi:peptidoglycan/LPS O-acetylase OafA/YrhL
VVFRRSFAKVTNLRNRGGTPVERVAGATAVGSAAISQESRPYTRPKDIPSLTGIRFFAATTILVGHLADAYRLPSLESVATQVEWLTWLGLPLFFVLSGFIIHTVYGPTFLRDKMTDSTANFIWARLTRLFPLMWLLVFATLAIDYQTIAALLAANPERWKILGYYLTGTFSWFYILVDNDALIQHSFGWSWSVSTELFFYVLYLSLARPIGRIQSKKRLTLFTIGYCVIMFGAFFAIDRTQQSWLPSVYHRIAGPFGVDDPQFMPIFARWLVYTSPYARCFEFILGCLVAQLCRLERREPQHSLKGYGLTVIALISILGLYRLGTSTCNFIVENFCQTMTTMSLNFLFAPSIALLLYCIYMYRSALVTVLEWKPIVILGEASYSIYLIHIFVTRIFYQNFSSPHLVFGSELVDFGYWLGFGALLTFCFAIGTFRAVELPARAWLRSVVRQSRWRLCATALFLLGIVWATFTYLDGYAGQVATAVAAK